MHPIHELCAAVIKQAVYDKNYDFSKRVSLNKPELRKDRRTAKLFLDKESKQLENFIDFWQMDIDANVVRRLAKEGK